jgi:hypothetical protein
MTERKCFNVEYSKDLTGRVTDAKNRAWVGEEVRRAMEEGKSVYVIVGEIVN